MTIKAFTIENFKGIHGPVRVEFKPITLLFGPNSAGKSTIVQALHYAREILERDNVDADRTAGADESFDLGGFTNLVHKHDRNLPIKLKFDLSFSPLADYSDFLTGEVNNAWIEFEIKWSNFLNAPLVVSSKVGLDGEYFAQIVCAEDGNRARITNISLTHHLLVEREEETEEGKMISLPALFVTMAETIKSDFLFPKTELETDAPVEQHTANRVMEAQLFISQKGTLPHFAGLNNELLRDDEETIEEWGPEWENPSDWEKLNDFFSTYFGGLTSVLRDELRKFRYIGPLRKTPSRAFAPLRTEDESRWMSGLAAWDVLNKADDTFVQQINSWLASKDRLNSGYRLELKRYKEVDISSPIVQGIREGRYIDNEAYEELIRMELESLPVKTRVFLREEGTGLEVLPQDVGVGISQVLPVVVVALHSTSGIVAIEQPELHIHPAFQVALGDLFVSQIKEREVCFLLETHSEHLLLRLMRRIRETADGELPPYVPELKPEELAIHYVEQTDNGMQISSIRIDKEGDFIDKWPRGFFPERYEELYK